MRTRQTISILDMRDAAAKDLKMQFRNYSGTAYRPKYFQVDGATGRVRLLNEDQVNWEKATIFVPEGVDMAEVGALPPQYFHPLIQGAGCENINHFLSSKAPRFQTASTIGHQPLIRK